MKLNIRNAFAEDMEQVHKLVLELAVFERAPDEVSTSAEMYKHDGFSENRFEVIVAEDEELPQGERIIGIALTYWAYSTWKGKYLWLEDLIVTESYRGKKIGKSLFEAVMKKALNEQANLLRWQVLDWNEPAIQFYNRYETVYQNDWLTCKLSRESILKLLN